MCPLEQKQKAEPVVLSLGTNAIGWVRRMRQERRKPESQLLMSNKLTQSAHGLAVYSCILCFGWCRLVHPKAMSKCSGFVGLWCRIQISEFMVKILGLCFLTIVKDWELEPYCICLTSRCGAVRGRVKYHSRIQVPCLLEHLRISKSHRPESPPLHILLVRK